MNETETNILRLLNSKDNTNKILGLMLGKSQLGISNLLDLIEDNIKPNGVGYINTVVNIDNDTYMFSIQKSDITRYILYVNWDSRHKHFHIYENSVTKFSKFLDLVL